MEEMYVPTTELIKNSVIYKPYPKILNPGPIQLILVLMIGNSGKVYVMNNIFGHLRLSYS
jgi:hypothetical protein